MVTRKVSLPRCNFCVVGSLKALVMWALVGDRVPLKAPLKARVPLAPEDWALLLYTDGLIEGRVGGTDRRLDVTGLQALISSAESQGVPREALAGWLVEQVEEANGGPLADDVAMLIVRPRPAA